MTANVFAAIQFDSQALESLKVYRAILLDAAPRTRIIPSENWHITLIFLGPTPRIDEAISILDAYEGRPLPLILGGFGTFGRGREKTLWVGVDPSPALVACQRRLRAAFQNAGFDVPDRAFKPHLTFTRRWPTKGAVSLDELRAAVQPITTEARSLQLLQSVQEEGKTRYIELFRKDLPDNNHPRD